MPGTWLQAPCSLLHGLVPWGKKQQTLRYGGEGALRGAQPGHEGTVPAPVLGWQHPVPVSCPCPASLQ